MDLKTEVKEEIDRLQTSIKELQVIYEDLDSDCTARRSVAEKAFRHYMSNRTLVVNQGYLNPPFAFTSDANHPLGVSP